MITVTDTPLILASASPRRKELLERLDLPIAVVPSRVDELEQHGESPEQHVIRLSEEKTREVAGRPEQPGRFFIGSDTVVLRDGVILGKPRDPAEARAMLTSLAGRSHRVLSGYAVLDRHSGRLLSAAVATHVEFKPLTGAEIDGYLATGEPFDKAGAYAIQGIGAFLVRRIEGSYTNVVGLPLAEVIEALEELGAVVLGADRA